MKYFLDAFRKWNDFNGRATQKEFWGFFGIHIVIYLLLRFTSANLLTSKYYSKIFIIVPIIGMIYTLISIIPTISVTTRRLHDIGKSGWWILLYFIPFLGWLVLLVFFLLPSQDVENKWANTKKDLYDNSEYDTLIFKNIKFIIFGVGFIISLLLGFYFKNYNGVIPNRINSEWKAEIFINRVISKSDFFELGNRFSFSWGAFIVGIILTFTFYILYTKVNFQAIKENIKDEVKPYLKDDNKSTEVINNETNSIEKVSNEELMRVDVDSEQKLNSYIEQLKFKIIEPNHISNISNLIYKFVCYKYVSNKKTFKITQSKQEEIIKYLKKYLDYRILGLNWTLEELNKVKEGAIEYASKKINEINSENLSLKKDNLRIITKQESSLKFQQNEKEIFIESLNDLNYKHIIMSLILGMMLLLSIRLCFSYTNYYKSEIDYALATTSFIIGTGMFYLYINGNDN